MEKARKVKRRSKGCCFLVLFFIVGVLLHLTACGEKPQRLEKKEIKTTFKKKSKKIVKSALKDEKEKSEEVVAYHYDPMGKKDPFKPLIREEKKITEKVLIKGPLTPLQKYTLAELKLVAIIMGIRDSKAMVEDSKGDGYIISKGTPIGDRYGEVAEIKRNEVIIVEKEIDPDSGEIIHKNVSLILYKPEEEEL